MKFIRTLSGMGAAFALLFTFGLALSAPGAALAQQTASNAFVRVVHAAPAAPNVDVYVDGAKLLTGFAFGTVTQYVPLAAGSHDIAVVPTGQDISKAVIKQSVTVNAGQNYTVAAIGNTTPAVTPALVAFADDNTVAANMAKVRVYHLSDNAGPVAVAAGGKTLIPSLAFQSASGYLTVPATAYSFTVTLLNNNTGVPLNATLDANKVTSVFALGEVGGTGTTVFKFVPEAVAGIPTGMPQTGVAPTPASPASGLPTIAWIGIVAAVLVALGGTGFAVSRRAR